MTHRRIAFFCRISLAAVVSFAIGCSESHEKTGAPPESERVELIASVTQLSNVVVKTLATDDRSRFEAIVPTTPALRKSLNSSAKPRADNAREDRIGIDESLQYLAAHYPGIRIDVLSSWSRVRRELKTAGVDFASLKVESFHHTRFREYGLLTTNDLRVELSAGAKRFTLSIDHCILIDGQWRIVGELHLTNAAGRNTARRP